MKYFTKEWHQGKLRDSQFNQMLNNYKKFAKENIQKFPANFVFLFQNESLHDGLIIQCIADFKTSTLSLDLVCGDKQKGYCQIKLKYFGVDLKKIDLKKIDDLVNSEDAELLNDEIDLDNKFFVHRMIFWPDYFELELFFEDFTFHRTEAKSRSIPKVKEKLLVIQK